MLNMENIEKIEKVIDKFDEEDKKQIEKISDKFEVKDYSLTIKEVKINYTYTVYNHKGVDTKLIPYNLPTGILYLGENLKEFNKGFIFEDKYKNLYDTAKKKIYFNNKYKFKFEGDLDKQAFSLFEGYDEIENKFKNVVFELKKDKSKEIKNKIKNEFIEELKAKLEKFDINNVILKYGKYFYTDYDYYYIHDNIIEYYDNNEKLSENDNFFQEVDNEEHLILLKACGNYKNFKDNYEGEIFYNTRIGKGKKQNDINNKFYFFPEWANITENLKLIKEDDEYILYNVKDKRITLEKNKKNPDGFAEIIIKDKNNEKTIYEIIVKLSTENKPIGNGIVKDKREGKLLLVNFDNNNIISNDLFDVIPKYIDEEEYTQNKLQKQNPKFKDFNLDPVNEIIPYNVDIKKEILQIDKLIEDINTIDKKMKEKIEKIKIESLGIRDQQHSGECWLYTIVQIILYANSRILGRKLDDFEKIHDKIGNYYSNNGKTNKDMEIIMNEYLPYYGLHYEKIKNENIDELRERLKRGIKCILTFDLNNKQWYNFTEYFDDTSIKQEDKLLTLDILNQPINEQIEDPDESDGHALILFDMDDQDNYTMVNSWGENWGYKGTFRAKRECFLDTQAIYSVHWFENELKPEEIQTWNEFPKLIINSLKEMNSIRCPICKRCAHIDQYEVVGNRYNKLRCPFKSKCEFEINYDNDNYEFILDQLITYDLITEKDVNKKFGLNFEFIKTIY